MGRFRSLLIVFALIAASLPGQSTVVVRGGTFLMGSEDRHNERPVRPVTVDDFAIFRFELTFGEYDAFARETNRAVPPDPMGWGRDSRPVIHVSWNDAVLYANWLSRRDGLTPAYEARPDGVVWNRSANGWRLPIEAEWEFAARGGLAAEDARYAGGSDIGRVAWFGGNSGGMTHPVGAKQPNELGLYDMSGNVAEWVWDRYAPYPDAEERNPIGPATGAERVVRGGSWFGTDESPRVTYRLGVRPENRAGNIGFRLVRSIGFSADVAAVIPEMPDSPPGESIVSIRDLPVISIEAGTFLMGDAEAEFDERPVNRVRLDAFDVMRAAVSRAEFDEFLSARGTQRGGIPGTTRPDGSAVNVTWFEAIAYANWLSLEHGLTPAYSSTSSTVTWDRAADGWRLPTEAEWEYAARGGSDPDESIAPSGRWEWVWDFYDGYPAADRGNPSGPEHGFFRVLRGGARADGLRTATARSMSPPSFRSESYGFRLVRSTKK